MAMRFVTMGVYGYTETTFVEALRQANIDVFVDTRRKRSVRGSEYAFANSKRLQETLKKLGIPYVHRLDLAPTQEMIRSQDSADQNAGRLRRDRRELTADFRKAYEGDILDGFDAQRFLDSLGDNVNSLLVFCVERVPDACHRSILAERLHRDLGGTIEHLTPDDAS